MKLDIDYDPLKENVSIIGYNQVGKSEFAKDFVKMLVHAGHSVIVFAHHENMLSIDPLCVKRTLYDIRGKGLEIFYPYQFTQDVFDATCSLVYSLSAQTGKANVVFVIDELHNWCKVYSIPDPLAILLQNAGNRNIGLVMIYHSTSLIPKEVVKVSQNIFCFYTDETNDIKYLKNILGDKVERFAKGTIPEYGKIYKKRGKPAVILNANNEVIE